MQVREDSKMAVTIRDIRVICTAPEGINLVVVKVETSEPGLWTGLRTFAYRHLAVKLVVEEYLKPLLVGRNVENIEDLWQLMNQNGDSLCKIRSAQPESAPAARHILSDTDYLRKERNYYDPNFPSLCAIHKRRSLFDTRLL